MNINWHTPEFKKLQIQGYGIGSQWYQRDDHFYIVLHMRPTSTTLRCADVLCPARWCQRKDQSGLAPVCPGHNHAPHTWMKERNIMYGVLRRRVIEEDTPVNQIYEEEATRYFIGAAHMPFKGIESTLRYWRKKAQKEELTTITMLHRAAPKRSHISCNKDTEAPSIKVLPKLAPKVVSCDEDTPAPEQDPPAPTIPQFEVRTSNVLTVIPQLQNPMSTNTILVPLGASSYEPNMAVTTTIPPFITPLMNPQYSAIPARAPQLKVRSDLVTFIPELHKSPFPAKPAGMPYLEIRGSDIITGMPQLQDPLGSTNPAIDPQLETPSSDSVTTSPERQDPLFELFADDSNPANQSEEPVYQLFDDPKPDPPKRQKTVTIRTVQCRACHCGVPWYVFIPCGHVICRKCFDVEKKYRSLCFRCGTRIESPLRMLFN